MTEKSTIRLQVEAVKFEMRGVFCFLLLVLVACLGLQAAAQQPTSPGTLVVGQVFTGQYDDFTTFGDNIVTKIVASDGTVLRFNGIGLHFYYPWSNYRALTRSFEGRRTVQSALTPESNSCAQHPSHTTSPATVSSRPPAPQPTLLATSQATLYAIPRQLYRRLADVVPGRRQACSWCSRFLQDGGPV